MPKEPPILVVNKPRRKSSTSSVKKTTTTSRNKKSGKGKKHTVRNIPRWILVLLAIFIVMVFSFGFYYFFIRPYAYRWKPCYGYKEYGVCMPYGYDVHGIDISHYQGDIDWMKLSLNQSAIHPIRFVFMKATEGGDLADDTFAQNFDSARAHGFIRGAYHFFNPQTDALKQADFFINTAKLDSGDLPPVLDIERVGRKSKTELVRNLKVWLNKVESHYGVKPILYASHKFKTKYLDDSLFNAYPYWIAHYYVDSVKYTGKWHFWQHTDVGSIEGIPEEVDLNVFNGTLQDLTNLTMKKKVGTN